VCYNPNRFPVTQISAIAAIENNFATLNKYLKKFVLRYFNFQTINQFIHPDRSLPILIYELIPFDSWKKTGIIGKEMLKI
jgi:hypothetical protein